MDKTNEQQRQKLLLSFGLLIKEKRIASGMSQEELAHRAGLHRTYVSDIERGARNLTLDSISKFAVAFNVPLRELFNVELLADNGMNSVNPRALDILLVEDNPSDTELTIWALERHGVANTIVAVQTGEEALNILLDHSPGHGKPPAVKPKVILLDLTLPGISGLAVLEKIRSEPSISDIPVVILTSSSSDKDHQECIRSGVTSYLTKPVDFVEFSIVMSKLGFQWFLSEKPRQ